MKRGARYAAALVVLCCVVATGCLSGEASLKVDGDGAGEFKAQVFPPGASRVPLRQVKIEKLLEDALSAAGGASVELVKKDGLTGYEIVVPFDDVDEMVSVMNTPMTVGAHKVSLFSQFSVVKEVEDNGDNWRLNATLNSFDQIFGPLTSDAAFAKVAESVKAGESQSGLEMNFVVDLPGQIVNSNATKRGGGSATWEITSTSAQTVITARSEPKEFPTTLQKGLLLAAAVIVLGFLLVAFSKWTSRSSATKRLKRGERKAIKARSASGSGWGPKGPNSMPTTPAPSTDIGRELPGVAPGAQAPSGTYDPVRGVRIGHTPTSDIPEPLIGVNNEHLERHSGTSHSHHDDEADRSGVKSATDDRAAKELVIAEKELALAEKELAIAERARKKEEKKLAKKLKKGKGGSGQVPPVNLPAAGPAPITPPPPAPTAAVPVATATAPATFSAPDTKAAQAPAAPPVPAAEPAAEPEPEPAQAPEPIPEPEPTPEPEPEPTSVQEPVPVPAPEPEPEPEPTPVPEPEPEPEPTPVPEPEPVPSSAVEGEHRVPRVFGAQPKAAGPVSDEEVAEAVVDAFSGIEGFRRWARGPLTDREVAETVAEALSDSGSATDAGPTTGPQVDAGTRPVRQTGADFHPESAVLKAAGKGVSDEPDDEEPVIEIEADWYPDPDDATRYRWWSGTEWTDYVC
ncbi:MAG: DUF2510 domain-containing protein [Microthrixaceae bacterium]